MCYSTNGLSNHMCLKSSRIILSFIPFVHSIFIGLFAICTDATDAKNAILISFIKMWSYAFQDLQDWTWSESSSLAYALSNLFSQSLPIKTKLHLILLIFKQVVILTLMSPTLLGIFPSKICSTLTGFFFLNPEVCTFLNQKVIIDYYHLHMASILHVIIDSILIIISSNHTWMQ